MAMSRAAHNRFKIGVVIATLGASVFVGPLAMASGVVGPVFAQSVATLTLAPSATASPTITPTASVTLRATAAPSRTPTLTPGPGQYVVKDGDYLAKIAGMFGISVRLLKQANNLVEDEIYPGQILIIPARPTVANPTQTGTAFPPGARTHVVQPGDQLLKLSRKYVVPVNQIRTANGLSSDTLYVGQVLFIPTAAPTATRVPPTPIPPGTVTYTVQVGDRIQRIAIWYGVTWKAIIDANQLDSAGTLRIGQVLVIPNPPRRPVTYTVQPGDTLQGLSERYQISIDFIRIANYNFRGDVLYEGLTLIIPMRPEMIQ